MTDKEHDMKMADSTIRIAMSLATEDDPRQIMGEAALAEVRRCRDRAFEIMEAAEAIIERWALDPETGEAAEEMLATIQDGIAKWSRDHMHVDHMIRLCWRE